MSDSDADIGIDLIEITRHGVTTKFVTSPGLIMEDNWHPGMPLSTELILADEDVPMTCDALIVMPHVQASAAWNHEHLRPMLEVAMVEIAHYVAHYVRTMRAL